MKKAGCILLLALPVVFYVLTIYSGAKRYQEFGKAVEEKLAEADRRGTPPKPATFAEAKRIAQESAARIHELDVQAIQQLLVRDEARLAKQAAAQVAGDQAAGVSCRAIASNAIQQSDSAAWWNVDFECRWGGDRLPNKTSVSVRLAKKSETWKAD